MLRFVWRCKEGDYSNRHRGAVVFHINAKRRHGDPKHNEGDLKDHLEWLDEATGEVSSTGPGPKPRQQKPESAFKFTEDPMMASSIRFVPRVYEVPNSQIVLIPFMAAKASGFAGDFSDWLAISGWRFFLDRGVNPAGLASMGQLAAVEERVSAGQ